MANRRKSKDEEKIAKEIIQQRFKDMFSGKHQPLSNASIQEVEALKARVAELEAGLAEQSTPVVSLPVPAETHNKPPSMKDKSPQKRKGPRFGVAAKSIFIISLVFILAAALQYQLNFRVAREEIEQAAREHSDANYEAYFNRVLVEQNAAEALAASIAQRADVRELYQSGDREALYELLLPMFNELKESNRVVHLYLEDTHGKVFLRVHDPLKFGDDVTYRGTTADALKEKRVTSGIEIGANRIGVRGVAPMYAGDMLIGLIEVGFDFDEQFVNDLKDLSGANYSIWITREAAAPAGLKPQENAFESPLESMFYYTGTITSQWNISSEVYERVLVTGEPTFEVITENTDFPSIVYIVPLRGYKDKIIGIFEIADSYRDTLSALRNTQLQILEIVIGLTVLGLALIAFFYQRVVLRPLSALTEFAQYQLSGDTSRRVFIKSHDEYEQLATLFNSFADSVDERQATLEQRVRDRTHDLELASEVGRSVAKNVTDFSQMLTEAAEMIRTRFNLYYTQIYLVDPSEQKIKLSAGTGEAGRELLRRGHYLVINSGSLNGRAVMEKRTQLVTDTSENPSFLPNKLLPNTRSEMSVPLIVSGRVVGVLDMQSEHAGAFSEANLAAFEALAGQLAIAIQNAELFAEVQEARSEVESQIRRFTKEGWQDFLDAIHQGQKIGFAFDESKVIRLKSDALTKTSEPNSVHLPMNVAGTKIGEISLPQESEQSLTTDEFELLQSTGAQLAQHVENLRLLAQAERYRTEAEQAVRRLTHEGWENFLKAYGELQPAYQYDLTEVKPLPNKNHDSSGYAIRHPMAVGNEVIGELAVNASSQSEEAADVIAAVAEQLSGHIENLRLSEINEKRAQREQTLRQITSSLRSSNNPTTIMRTAVRELGRIMGRRAVVRLASPQSANEKESPVSNENKSDALAHQS